MSLTTTLTGSAQKAYVALMMDVIKRGLVSASKIDPEIRSELQGYPAGTTLQMKVLPDGAGFTVQVQPDHSLKALKDFKGKPDLSVQFKSPALAFLVFSFQEATTVAFAHNRMIADGDVSYAIRLIRILNRMESVILPKLVATRAVKKYPTELKLSQKLPEAASIYASVAKSYLPLFPAK